MGRVSARGCVFILLAMGGALAATRPADTDHARPALSAFEEPLIRSVPTRPAEDEALFQAIRSWQQQPSADDLAVFDRFLTDFPHSGWRVALLLNLGLSYYHNGYFSRAIQAWEETWEEGRRVREPQIKALVDRGVGELARMHARLGHADRLEALFREIGDRPVTGAATETLQGAREGLWRMRNEPGTAYLCGPMALKNLLLSGGATLQQLEFLDAVRSGPHGVSLAEVAALADQAKLGYRLIFREAGQPIPVPAIVHWKVTHFAAIVEEADGRYHLKDPTFGQDLWVSRAAIESESSGYFLAPAGQLIAGWREVPADEAAQVRGMGLTGDNQPGASTNKDKKKTPTPGKPCGMCGYNVHMMLVSLNLEDVPLPYAPPIGPPIDITVTYNQRESIQPAIFTWFNLSPKWTMNWLSYIEDDPKNARADVNWIVGGGGYVTFSGFNPATNAYIRNTRDASLLVRTSATPITYERQLATGGREVYATSNNAAASPRRVFLSQVIDPLGNTVNLKYDGQTRLIAIIDALGRITTLSYDQSSHPLLVTKVTDPFGRSAKFSYDPAGRLVGITDVLGLTSQFSYDSSNLVNAVTTPYGTSKFTYGQTGTTRFLEATDALGYKERVEFHHAAPGIAGADALKTLPKGMPLILDEYLEFRNTFYWDKHLYPIAAGDYTKANLTHFDHWLVNQNYTGHTVESVKKPLENRIWFAYPGQPNTAVSGALDKTNYVGRVLDDGSTQLTHIDYNALGHPTLIVDPVGRETQFVYDSNLIDLLQVKRKTSATGYTTIAQYIYNSHHQPLTMTNAAGQVTAYAYNSVGQITQVTDALGETTTYEYDIAGRLSREVNANGQTAQSLTYDSFDRVASRTDSEGYTVNLTYDALNRVTKEAYPDGTSRDYTWDKLDLVSVRDRQGRLTVYTYDAVRNLVAVTDAMGRRTKFSYYENGVLKSITDPNGNTTTWDIDIQNRVTAKHYPDGTKVTYAYENTSSRVKSITDALGQQRQFTYTVDNQVAAINYLNAQNPTPNVSFTYDPYFKRVTSMTDGSGPTQYQYQPPGSPGALQLAQQTGPFVNTTIAYQYDALDRVIGRTVDSSTDSFTYDPLGRLMSHTSDLGAFDLTYLGQTAQMTGRHPRGTTLGTDWTYDSNTNDRRLTAIANGGPARGYQYTTTPERLLSQVVETAAVDGAAPAQAWNYTYDAADRLLQSTSSGGQQFSYGYDAADNIMSQQSAPGALNATYNALNQITGLDNGQPFVYDANGNVTDDGVRTYGWDAENRLISATTKTETPQTTTFRYDGVGRRIAIVAPDGTETRYLWCGETLCQARDGNDIVTRRYYPEGELVIGGAGLLYGQDHLGSVRDVLSAADGSLVASYDYDTYGNPLQPPAPGGTDFRYAGMFYEPNTGLYLTPRRVYDPVTARWLSRDPLSEASGLNLYSYAAGNPTKYKDPQGEEVAGAIIGAVAGGIAGYIAGRECGGDLTHGLIGAAIGAVIGGVVGLINPMLIWAGSDFVSKLVAYELLGTAAGGVAGLTTNLVLGAGDYIDHGQWSRPLDVIARDTLSGMLAGGIAPLISGETLLFSSGLVATEGPAAIALGIHSGIFSVGLGEIFNGIIDHSSGEGSLSPEPAIPVADPYHPSVNQLYPQVDYGYPVGIV